MGVQQTADATGIPRLSAATGMAIGIVATAPDDKIRAGAWRAVWVNERVADELWVFAVAVNLSYSSRLRC